MKLELYPRAPQTLADQLFQAGVEFPCGGEIACGGCEVPRDTPHANLDAMTRFARRRS